LLYYHLRKHINHYPLFFLIVAIFSGVIFIASGCGEDEPTKVVYRGRSLEIHLEEPVIVESMAFTDNAGQHRILRPKASNRQLALVNITIVNRTSTITPLLIDDRSAQLGDRRSDRIYALDPFTEAAILESAGPEEGKFLPLLWGEVVLERNFQATGYMVFDVPKGLTLSTVWWNEADSIISDFTDYQRKMK